MTGVPVRTIFLGSGTFAEPILRRLHTDPAVDLVAVVTAPPRAAGRDKALTATPVHDLARDLAITPVLTPERLRGDAAIADVRSLDPGLLVLADYGRIVPAALLQVEHGALNVHPSLLPRHRGATPIPAALLAGDQETGVTIIDMDAGIDTGPVVAQQRVRLVGRETAPELEGRLAREGAELLATVLGPWLRGERRATPQATVGATLTRPLRRADGRLDPTRSSVDLERQIRAYQPWPGTFVETPAGRLVLWAAEPDPRPARAPSGTFEAAGLGVGDDELLRLIEVQPAGGTRMQWEAFVRGRPTIVGSSIRA